MSHTLALHPVKKRDAIFLWFLGWLAFSPAAELELDYGLLESTSDEILEAYGWSQFNISWLWYLLPKPAAGTPVPRSQTRTAQPPHPMPAGRFVYRLYRRSAITVEGRGLGYATIVLFVAGSVMTLALTRLEMAGRRSVCDRFAGHAIVALIGIFIVWPSIAIFHPDVSPTTPGFAPLAFMNVLSWAYHSGDPSTLSSVDCGRWLPSSVSCWRFIPPGSPSSAIVGRIFSILPIVTPPFVVGWASR